MDVKTAVKDKANYAEIVAWFREQRDPDAEELALLADTAGEMSEEIYEYRRALCDLLKERLQQVRRACKEQGCETVFPDPAERKRLAYAVEKACRVGAVLPEKYAGLLGELDKGE